MPTAAAIVEFVRESPVPLDRRAIARHFNVKGDARVALKRLLREMADRGDIDLARGRKIAATGQLPEIMPLHVIGLDEDGELLAAPLSWPDDQPQPSILLLPQARRAKAVGIGDRVLGRLERRGDNSYEARVIRAIDRAPLQVIGVFYTTKAGAGQIQPTDRKSKSAYEVAKADRGGAEDGDLVVADVLAGTRFGLKKAVITERFASLDDPRSISLLCIREADIPDRFPAPAIAAAEAAKPVALGKREDLRGIPLVTIDGADARDFDDAVWAAPDPDDSNPGGWLLLVAIADVAHYVHHDSALDREAQKRGNSVYFPDRVVPMLPEALSNGLCSLRPDEDRACMAVEMTLDRHGIKRRHRFIRGLMRSAARLTYEQAQQAHDQGQAVAGEAGLIPALFGVFQALNQARVQRGALEIELPERQIIIGDAGDITGIGSRQRLDSHRLIEEFMVLANVAAAETLEKQRQICMYRVHDQPAADKVENLREFLEGLTFKLSCGQVIRPHHFNQLLSKAADSPHAAMVNELVLRAQSQAVYSPENIGHFGLGLTKYAHFTSPIRRYADLMVHRALIAGLKLGDGGHGAEDFEQFNDVAAHISMTERRAANAERSANDRFTARFLADRVGSDVRGRVTSVTRFGLFVCLDDTGADGLIPIATLPDDYYDHDEMRHQLVGRSNGWCFSLGDVVEARLSAVDPGIGRLTLKLISGGKKHSGARPPRRSSRRPAQRRKHKPATRRR